MDTPTTTLTTAPVPVTVPGGCPACGCAGNVLFSVVLSYGGDFRPDYFNVIPEQGDTITRCDECGAFFVHADDGTPLGTPSPAAASAPAVAGDDGQDAANAARIADLEAQVAAADILARSGLPVQGMTLA